MAENNTENHTFRSAVATYQGIVRVMDLCDKLDADGAELTTELKEAVEAEIGYSLDDDDTADSAREKLIDHERESALDIGYFIEGEDENGESTLDLYFDSSLDTETGCIIQDDKDELDFDEAIEQGIEVNEDGYPVALPDSARILLAWGGGSIQLRGQWTHEECGLGTWSGCYIEWQDWGLEWCDIRDTDGSLYTCTTTLTNWANMCYGY